MPRLVHLLFLTCMLLCQHTYADDCLGLFKQAFRKIKEFATSEGLSMKYSVKVQMADGAVYSDNIQVAMFNKKAKITSEDFTIYQDTKTMIVIQQEANAVFVTTAGDGNFRKSQLSDFVTLQDSIFKYLILKSCIADQSIGGDGHIKKLTFQFPALMRKNLGIASVSYWIDEQNIIIKKIHLEYLDDEERNLRSLDFEFLLMDNTYAQSPFEGLASAKVFDAKNKLRPEFQEYTLIDKR